MMRVSSSADGRPARPGGAAGSAGCAFFDERLAAMPDSVRNQAARRQGDEELRLQPCRVRLDAPFSFADAVIAVGAASRTLRLNPEP